MKQKKRSAVMESLERAMFARAERELARVNPKAQDYLSVSNYKIEK